MKKTTIIIAAMIVALAAGGALYYLREQPSAPKMAVTTSEVVVTKQPSTSNPLTSSTMKLTSPAFEHNQNIPSKYTCDDANVNPALQISEVPENAVSLALLVDDPDAVQGDWTHWIVMNMPPSTAEIPENSVPEGLEGTTDFNSAGWGGPCPPSGTHRYFFKLFALDTTLDLPPSAKKADLLASMEGHIIEQTELIGLYQRQ